MNVTHLKAWLIIISLFSGVSISNADSKNKDAKPLLVSSSIIKASAVNATTLRVPLMVRTINFWNTHRKKPVPYYPHRQAKIADLVYRDGKLSGHKYSPGFIGLQEVRKSMKHCQASKLRNKKPNGAKCFAGLLEDRYKRPVHSINRAMIYGDDWELIEKKKFRIGPSRNWREFWGTDYRRDLYEAFLRHKASGLKVRFYDTHFWPNKKKKKVRKIQAKELVAIVKKRVRSGELPPILTGDFNFANDREDSFKILSKYFEIAARESIDVVYVGKKSAFPLTYGKIEINRTKRNLPLAGYGYNKVQLSDHNSAGAYLYLDKCACSAGQTRQCPSHENAIQKCDGCNYTGVCYSKGRPGGSAPRREPRYPSGGAPN